MKKTLNKLSVAIVGFMLVTIVLSSCGSSKTAGQEGVINGGGSTGKPSVSQKTEPDKKEDKLSFLRNVTDNAAYSANISAPIDLMLNGNFSVAGKLQMRRNEVIRITIVPLGIMEMARIEFSPNGVLLVNRMEKTFCRATYADVPFLKSNGMDFYALQSLFWNELFMPGTKSITDSCLPSFSLGATTNGARIISLKHKDLQMKWQAEEGNYRINSTEIAYKKDTPQQGTIKVEYSDFAPLGTKSFPTHELLTFSSKASGKVSLNIKMQRLDTSSNWDAATTVSSKYKQVTAKEMLSRLSLAY